MNSVYKVSIFSLSAGWYLGSKSTDIYFYYEPEPRHVVRQLKLMIGEAKDSEEAERYRYYIGLVKETGFNGGSHLGDEYSGSVILEEVKVINEE